MPRAEIGSPTKGAQLGYPFAESSIKVGAGVTLGFTPDTASAPTSGPSTSVGQALQLSKDC